MKRLQELREKSDLSHCELAKKVGVSRSFYTQIENGTRTPSLKVAIRIANFFGVGMDEIFLPHSVATSVNDHAAAQERAG